MGLVLVVLGGIFSAGLWRSYQRAMTTRSWVETPCRILSSVVLTERPTFNSPAAFRLGLTYEYQFQGSRHTGSKVRRIEGPTPHKDKVEALAAKFPAGHRLSCWVNPDRPEEAVLEHSTKAALYAIWFPLLFVLGGGVMAARAFRKN